VTRRPTLIASTTFTLLLAAVLTACGASSGSSAPSASQPALPTVAPTSSPSGQNGPSPDESIPEASLAPFACALPIRGAATAARAQITDLRMGAHESYDRIVVEFAAGTPEYTIEKAVPPLLQDPSGLAMQVQGSSFLRIVLHGGTVQLPNGGTSYGGATSFTPHFVKLIDLQSAGDFEAVSTWYVGMSGDACVRVFTLTAPSRLVIDLQH
jgi:hypothetical protein